MPSWISSGVLVLALGAAGEAKVHPSVEAYRKLEREYESALAAFQKAYREAKTTAEQQEVFREKHPRPGDYAPRFLALAKKHPTGPAAVDALVWVVNHPAPPGDPAGALRARALLILRKEHRRDERLGRLCTQLVQSLDPQSEDFLVAVLAGAPSAGVKARACASLAQNLKYRGRLIPRLKGNDEARTTYEQAWGKQAVRALLKRDAGALLAQSENLFERVIAKYGQVKHPVHGSLAGLARANLLSLRRPVQVGKSAPEIVGEDAAGKKRKLSDYSGKVVLLDFWAFRFPSAQEGIAVERSLLERLAGKPFVVLGVNGDGDRKGLAEKLKAEKVSWVSWFDGGYPGGPIATRWDVEVWPTLFLIDHMGVVRKRFIGWTERKALEEAIDELVRRAGKAK
jgi:peroxiredoxin